MLYGSHVFARAKVIPDLALARGEQAHALRAGDRRSARSSSWLPAGRRWRTSTSARSTTAKRWLDRAAVGRLRASDARSARAGWRPGAGSRTRPRATPQGMRAHLERAVQHAADSGLPAARCEALARLAAEAVAAGRRAGPTRTC